MQCAVVPAAERPTKKGRFDKQSCDLTIVVDQYTAANELVLQIKLHYPSEIFVNGLSDYGKSRMELKNIDLRTIESILDLIYTNEAVISNHSIAASIMQMSAVNRNCAVHLSVAMNPSNCMGIRVLAQRYSHAALLSQTKFYIETNFELVAKSDEFVRIELDQLTELVKNFHFKSKELVYESLMRWLSRNEARNADHDCERNTSVFELMRHIYNSNYKGLYEISLDKGRVARLVPDGLAAWCQLPNIDVTGLADIVHSTYSDVGIMYFNLNNEDRITIHHLQTGVRGFIHFKAQTRSNFGICCHDNYLYIVGGLANNVTVNTVEKYSLILRKWFPCSPSKIPRKAPSCVALGDYIYAIGPDKTVERYDIKLDSWEDVAQTIENCPSDQIKCAMLDGYIYVAHSPHGSIERYDPVENKWDSMPSVEKGKISTLTSYNGQLYIVIQNPGNRFFRFFNNRWDVCFSNSPCENIHYVAF